MSSPPLKIGFVRRGYSPSGGAEAYLKRLAAGVRAGDQAVMLVTTAEWPAAEWAFGELVPLRGKSPLRFADEVERWRLEAPCDVLLSLERVWRCDVYRAGDGVHRAWLERRARGGGPLDRLALALNSKHRGILRLEEALLGDGGAKRVIANSEMVKHEITATYGYPEDRIEVVYNGTPLEDFRFTDEDRAQSRAALHLASGDVAVLFVGSGWERKGLAYALQAIDALDDRHLKLLVAGRGNERRYRSGAARFLGEVGDVAALYRAADIFILPTLYDPFSNACLEALASGLPVITTRANGFGEIIEDQIHGSIVEAAEDIAALRRALELWADPRRRSAARSGILHRAAQFDMARNVEQTITILTRAAG